MDEDDGMMLNFATSSSEPSSRLRSSGKVTGGNWKERRKMTLELQGRGRNEKKHASGVNSSLIDTSNNKIEKARLEKRPGAPQNSMGTSSKKIKFEEAKGQFGGKNSSYVSSLFTSNNTSSQLTPTLEKENKSYLPSNAPLQDATTFDGLGLNDKLAAFLKDTLKFANPTNVQRMVVPKLLSGTTDLFVKAQTGSGKTLSFLLPIIHKLMMENTHKISRDLGLFAVILTPTRELATQIYGVMESLSRCHHQIVPGIVIGGEKKKSEKARLRKGVNILVATPGRLADHLENTTSLDISQLRWLILDEGDKLVELGFEETITKITDKITQLSMISETTQKWQGLPTKRVNVLCSATMQNNVEKLGSIILKNPEMVTVDSNQIEGTVLFGGNGDSVEHGATAPDQLVQQVVVIPPKLRLVTLSAILRDLTRKASATEEPTRTIIFFSCSDSVNFHFDVFTRDGRKFKNQKDVETGKMVEVEIVPRNSGDQDDDEELVKGEELGRMTAPTIGHNTTVFKLHGSLLQQVRALTLSSFIKSSSKHSILFCTDVASRGLDLPNISSVIEYDPPFTIDDHLHRIGRLARVGNEGLATLFLLPGNEEGYVDGKLKIVHPKQGSLRIVKYDSILEKGFADVNDQAQAVSASTKKADPKMKLGKWDIHATTWHLDVERWLLEDNYAHDRAVQAFTSHIRAYTTHMLTERAFFNVKLLHLGHLAKSFGLRETPKKLGKSIGLESAQEGLGSRPKKEDPRKKMLRMAKLAVNTASSEFNY